ncbi:amino acid adenylation domain-containing protein [Lysobacter solisilvae]|uniref:Amino acid adenylation domain-containing protein n=1 Tax=Agrilutibacter solisilvae TaxID=2763317 RepID=A0A974Y1P1_9GAMM|nr:non-ribosomal peptide synthetase [Lysobacter solisilvae]QSX79618.1 amino acid adenylation domain-containing protein [Lysobacter solisilvae]
MSADQNQALQQLRRAVALQRLQQRGGPQQDVAIVPTIPTVDRSAPLPVSWAQQRLWFLDQLDHAAGAAYHVSSALRLTGELNRDALQASLDRIVARHETLRTRFVIVDGAPRQVIGAEDSGFLLLDQDLRSLDASAQAAEMAELSASEACAPFDLSTGPLIRGRLLQLAPREHVLLVTQHHIVSDGWSTGLLVKEVSALYTAYCKGQDDPLPPLQIQYADYAAWQRQWLQGDVLQGQIDFWRTHLQGAPALLELPTDRPRPPVQSYNGARAEVSLSVELSAALRALSQRHGVTLYMTLLAGWSTLLSRLSGQSDVVIGSPVANRQRSEVEPLIGFFVNTLALRVDLTGEPTVAELLAQVKATTLGAYAHQDLPFEQVVEVLQPARSLAHSPVFQVLLGLNNTPGGGELTLPGLTLAQLQTARHSAQFDLAMSLSDSPEGLAGSVIYASDLFDAATITTMLQRWTRLLEAMVADDTQRVSRLPLLSAPEREQVLGAFNATDTAYPDATLIHSLIQAQVARQPDAIALEFDGQRLDYATLNRRANRLAHRLIAMGVQPDDRVAICVERGIGMVVGLLGVLKAGGAYVPLDPAYPDDRLAWMLGDSAPVALLTQSSLRDRLAAWAAVPTLELDAPDDASDVSDHNPEPAGHHPGQLAYVIYTSGSTGRPKGVMVEHRGLCNLATAQVRLFDVRPGSHVLQFASFSFDASISEIVMALCAGACLHLAPREALRPGAPLLATLRERHITHVTLPSSALQGFAVEDLADTGLTLILAGEALPPTARKWARGHRLINAYGPTETTVCASAYVVPEQDSGVIPAGTIPHSTIPHSTIPIGAPIANTRIYILDPAGEPVPVGVAGELYIGGVGVARGYLNRPELTAERFVRDPFARGNARMYRTGDLGRWRADGSIEYLGRNDFQVKLRGFRIELGEIEAQLLACEGVREAAVIAREDGGDRRLVAYLVAGGDVELSVPILRDRLASALPEHMVPSAIVRLEALPLTPNGKLDRRALPAPDHAAVASRPYEAPVGATEQAIAAIWQDLLGLERVGRHDHFFELGGHSLLVISLIERMRNAGMDVDVRAVFAAPALSALADRLHSGAATAARAPVPPNLITTDTTHLTPDLLPLVRLTQEEIDRIVAGVPTGASGIQDIYPLAPLQEGILFHHLMGGEGDTYLLRMVVAFDSGARMHDFVKLVQTVVDRHDILRSTVHWEDLPQPVQVVHRQVTLPLHQITVASGEAVLPQFLAATDPRRLRLDLRQAPMLAAYTAFDPDSGESLLALLSHHMVCDHVAMDLILSEIQLLLEGQGDLLPEPVPYRNFIAQAHAVPDAEHEAYFRQQLADIDEPTAPFGVLAQEHGTSHEESRIQFSDTLAQQIRDAARQHGVSTAVLFHVGWAQVLAQCSGRDDVVFGTVLSGRMQSSDAADKIVGMFINSLPIRMPLAGMTVTDAVREAYARLGELLAHEQAPLALAQRCSGVPAGLPLFTALLNYRFNNEPGQTSDAAATQAAWQGVRVLSRGRTHGSYPMTMSVEDWGQALGLSVLHMPGIDGERLVRYLEQAMQSLVDALAHTPALPMRQLAVLPPQEREHLLRLSGGDERAWREDVLVHELFEAQARDNPDAVALVCAGQTLTYGELDGRANQLARFLRTLGVKPDQRVAICMERGIEMVVALLGVMKAGGAYVPLDPHAPAERLAGILRTDPPLALLTVLAVEESLPALSLLRVVVVDDEPAIARQSAQALDRADGLTPAHLAYVIYTSGSTGMPKGVMVPHQGVVNYLMHASTGYLRDDIRGALVATPLGFDATVTTLLAPWLAGKPVVLLAEESEQCLVQLLEYCRRPEPWLFKLTPAHLDVLSNLAHAAPVATAHRLVVGGEQLTARTLRRFRENVLPHAIVVNEYGPTEAVVGCTTFVSDGREPALAGDIVPIGRPIANTRLHILGSAGEPVPVGVVGEIFIGGAGVVRGYLNRPALTEERFVPDPFAADPGARLYRTGDLARWRPDGNIEYLGRNDFQVKIRGFRIELGEIEARLASCAGVRDAVVLARDDAAGDQRLVAYVVPEDEQTAVSVVALRDRMLRELPDYMVPNAFVTLAALPLTSNGKVDRKALPAPDQSAVAAREYEAPTGELECVIAGIWQDLLSLERVGRHDHFFELGGHSLLAVRLVTRLRAVLGVEVPLSEIFAQPTLAQLAACVSGAAASAQGAIVPVDRSRALPLSWAQQRLWFLDQLDHSAGAAYHIPAALRLSGELDRAALRASLDRIVARHESLRTRFVSVDGSPQQLIAPDDAGFALFEHDLRSLDDAAQEAAVAELGASESRALFDLATGPLIRGRLLRLAEHEHVLLVTQHHIISDGWSIGVLVREVCTLYTAFSQGQPDPLLPLPVQYADYAAWQRQWLQGDVLQQQIDFWRNHLTGAPELLELPTDRPRPAAMSYAGASVPVRFSRELSDALHALSRRHGATLFMTLMAGWSALLSRLSGQDDIVIGSPVANRQRTEIEPLIGFFVNTLAFRVKLDSDPSVAQLLAQVRATTLSGYAHQDLPIEQVVEALQPARSLSHNALFQVSLSLNNTPGDDGLSRLPGLTLSGIDGHQKTTRFDLSLSMVDSADGLVGAAIYATDLFDRDTMERMLGHWVSLLAAMAADDTQAVSRLPLLTPEEREHLLVGLNGPAVDYPRDGLVHAMFEAQAARQPEAVALEFAGRQLSYGELNHRANQVAHRLIASGVRPDDRVAVCADRGLAMIVGVLGILKAGGAYVPLDPLYPADRLAWMVADSAPAVVLAPSALRERLPMLAAAGCPVLSLEDIAASAPDTPLANPHVPGLTSRHLAYVIYTSGSTGQPKGVMVEHASVMNLHTELERTIFGALGAHDRVGLNAALSFDSSIKSLLQLLSGRCVVVVPQAARAEGTALLEFLRSGRIDAIDCTPAQLESLLAAGLLQESTSHAPKAVLIGGEAIPAPTWQRLARCTSTRFFNVYGPTECTVDSSIALINGAGERPQIGRPIANARIYILDAQRQAVPMGAFGELYIAGAGVARGYLGRPDLTAERFVEDPFVDGPIDARMYRTGDVGRWLPDGTIEFTGRNDFQVKIRGFRIELGEIESRLRACAGVREAVVIAREDATGDKRLVSYLVPHEGAALSAAALREQLLLELPDYMVPGAFVTLAALPLTPNGKLDRKALPAPDQAAVASRAFEAPVGEAEEAIAAIWQELLGLDRVGRHDHFFELGGHSLLAVRVVVRLKDVLQVQVDLRDVFTSPQLSTLAELIVERQIAQFDPAELMAVLDSMEEAAPAQ